MFVIQNVVKRAPGLLKLSENQCRTILSTPPRVRMPFIEKVAFGVILWLGMMATPLYVACHVKKYNEKKG
ncbi:unnamed protein product [Xylocopa violacea]|uniref:Uncharacterized protein n=1 Tax=Xylocopa violacea TaxID=135666 RepID=A0ABP1NWU6_XYLVO